MIKYSGVSLTTAMNLMIYSARDRGNKEAVASSGLVPYIRKSGNKKGQMTTAGCGRPIVKRVLYMEALNAIRYNKEISAFYNKLVKNGKKK